MLRASGGAVMARGALYHIFSLDQSLHGLQRFKLVFVYWAEIGKSLYVVLDHLHISHAGEDHGYLRE